MRVTCLESGNRTQTLVLAAYVLYHRVTPAPTYTLKHLHINIYKYTVTLSQIIIHFVQSITSMAYSNAEILNHPANDYK